MTPRTQLTTVALALLTLSGLTVSLIAQSASEPINAAQLKTLLNETKVIKAEKAQTQSMLKERQKQLPEWFPPTFRGIIGGQVSSVNPVKGDLPIYQKYITKDQADQLILFFQGPAGDAVASKLPPVAQQAATPAELDPLITARISQLDAAQQPGIKDTVTAYQAALPKIRTDQGMAFDAAYDKAKSDVIAAHQSEYDAAATGNGGPGSSLSH
jgi:hypothetical protein